jgi:hypothetical protein
VAPGQVRVAPSRDRPAIRLRAVYPDGGVGVLQVALQERPRRRAAAPWATWLSMVITLGRPGASSPWLLLERAEPRRGASRSQAGRLWSVLLRRLVAEAASLFVARDARRRGPSPRTSPPADEGSEVAHAAVGRTSIAGAHCAAPRRDDVHPSPGTIESRASALLGARRRQRQRRLRASGAPAGRAKARPALGPATAAGPHRAPAPGGPLQLERDLPACGREREGNARAASGRLCRAAARAEGVGYLWIGGGCGGGEPAGRLFNTCMAMVIIPATSETLAGTTSVVDFWASWPNFSTYCSATRSCTAS